MANYFNPWRRKLGVLTLLLALLAMGGWIRSLVVNDRVEFFNSRGIAKHHNTLAGFETIRQSLVFFAYKVDTLLVGDEMSSPSDDKVIPLPESMIANPPAFVSIESLSASPGTGKLTTAYQVPVAEIPFWSIVAPLAVCAAYWLLSKPRVAKQKFETANA